MNYKCCKRIGSSGKKSFYPWGIRKKLSAYGKKIKYDAQMNLFCPVTLQFFRVTATFEKNS